MKKRIGQVFSLALAVVLVIAMAIPAHADVSDAAGYVVGEFWDMMTGKEYDMFFDYWQNFVGYLAGEECPSSPDKYHHGNVPVGGVGVLGSGGTDDNGKFVWYTCDYCGGQFKVYASDLQQSYDAQVEELPSSTITPTGYLYYFYPDTSKIYAGCSGLSVFSYTSDSCTILSSGDRVSFDLRFNYDWTPFVSGNSFLGNVTVLEFPTHSEIDPSSAFSYERSGFCTLLSSSNPTYGEYLKWCKSSSSNSTFLSLGETVTSGLGFYFSESSSRVNCYYFAPCSIYGTSYVTIKFTPLVVSYEPIDLTGAVITQVNSRPTSITGDYGIIGDNGQITKVEGNTIVNETNNTVYNPVTGETKTMSDWSYNYEDRSYTVTLEGGTTQTITYGDENVTIVEGDTTYNVYYLVNGSGSENPGPEVCDHTWTETGRTEPTCTTSGKVTSACSKCGQTKTETIPATGHSWVVDRTVQTTYDEEGNLLQQGYTIYSCSVCGEQYKDMEGAGPPGPSDGDNSGDGGLIEFLDGLVKSLSENLHGVVELISSFFREIPSMFNGFLAFLTAMFPFLPPELMTLLTFGIAAVVLIGVIKAIRR